MTTNGPGVSLNGYTQKVMYKYSSRKKTDIENIWQINVEAFETEEEANLVNALRSSGVPYISLVYEENNELVGYIFFTPVSCKNYSGKFMVRVPPDIHRKLAVEATEAGVSLNRLASSKLSQ